jgi:hypothetical protein
MALLMGASVERSETRERRASLAIVPDFAPLNPGYIR